MKCHLHLVLLGHGKGEGEFSFVPALGSELRPAVQYFRFLRRRDVQLLSGAQLTLLADVIVGFSAVFNLPRHRVILIAVFQAPDVFC